MGRPTQPKPRSALADWRLKRGMTQMDMVTATGINRATYRRLEHGRPANPKVGLLVNCAIVLGCQLEDIFPLHWQELDARAPEPEQPAVLWHRKRKSREQAEQRAREVMEAEFEAAFRGADTGR